MRRAPTASEAALWQTLRNRALGGAKFRRQRPLGRYTADFCCDAARPVIELDGPVHETADRRENDALRDCELAARGYALFRVDSNDVAGDLSAVLEAIARALARWADRSEA